MGIFDNLKQMVAESASQAQSDSLDFQDRGLPPERDKDGRVIIRLGSGAQIVFRVNTNNVDEQAIAELMGKPNADFEERTTHLRMSIDTESLFEGSVKL